MTLGIIGAAGLAIALVKGTLRLPTQIATLMFAPPALLYIWRPTITPDQIWAARRFLPAAFPAIILLTFAVLCVASRAGDPKLASFGRSIAIVFAVATVLFPWLTVRHVSQMTEQRGMLPIITDDLQDARTEGRGRDAAGAGLERLPQ